MKKKAHDENADQVQPKEHDSDSHAASQEIVDRIEDKEQKKIAQQHLDSVTATWKK